jgi:uncharacterized protein YbaP (TraB family)
VEHITGKAFLDSSIAVWYQGNPKPTDQYKRTTEYIKRKTLGIQYFRKLLAGQQNNEWEDKTSLLQRENTYCST